MDTTNHTLLLSLQRVKLGGITVSGTYCKKSKPRACEGQWWGGREDTRNGGAERTTVDRVPGYCMGIRYLSSYSLSTLIDSYTHTRVSFDGGKLIISRESLSHDRSFERGWL